MTGLTKERRRVALHVLAGSCAGLLIVLVITVLVSTSQSSSKSADLAQAIRDTQKTNTALNTTNAKLLHQVADLSRRIHSCTTPGKPCHDRSQHQLATTVTGLNASTQRAAAASAACAATIHDPTFGRVLECELNALTRHK
jgi:hypothetical protein